MRDDDTTPPPDGLEGLVWIVATAESDARLKKNIKVS
jgi:hypothetical protein